MELIQTILIFLLIFSLVSGLVGVFYYENYLKKIACLSVSYTNLIIILIIFSKNSEKASQLFNIITTILILFSITLAIGIGIIANIAKLNNQKSAQN
ncbi:MAG: hypothetical protein V4612_00425 [Pseudomonadota bacterium]